MGNNIATKKRTKATNRQVSEREEYAYNQICRGCLKSDIITKMIDIFGLSEGNAGRYHAEGLRLFDLRSRKSRAEYRRESLAFYESVKRDDFVPIANRIAAQQRIDKVLGLERRPPPNQPPVKEIEAKKDEQIEQTPATQPAQSTLIVSGDLAEVFTDMAMELAKSGLLDRSGDDKPLTVNQSILEPPAWQQGETTPEGPNNAEQAEVDDPPSD